MEDGVPFKTKDLR